MKERGHQSTIAHAILHPSTLSQCLGAFLLPQWHANGKVIGCKGTCERRGVEKRGLERLLIFSNESVTILMHYCSPNLTPLSRITNHQQLYQFILAKVETTAYCTTLSKCNCSCKFHVCSTICSPLCHGFSLFCQVVNSKECRNKNR